MANPQSNPARQPHQDERVENLATASLIVGLLSGLVPVLAGIAAAVLGHAALRRIKATGRSGRGMAIAGTILGYLNIVVLGLGITFAIVLPLLVHQQHVQQQVSEGRLNPQGSLRLDASLKNDLRDTVSALTTSQAMESPTVIASINDAKTHLILVFNGRKQTATLGSEKLNIPKYGAEYKVCAYNENAQDHFSPATAFGYDAATGLFDEMPNCT